MMSLYELVEGMLDLFYVLYDAGAMTMEEEELFNKYEEVWYNYYEKELRRDENEN